MYFNISSSKNNWKLRFRQTDTTRLLMGIVPIVSQYRQNDGI